VHYLSAVLGFLLGCTHKFSQREHLKMPAQLTKTQTDNTQERAAHQWLVLSQSWKEQEKNHLQQAALNLSLLLNADQAVVYYLRSNSRDFTDLRSLSDLNQAVTLAPEQKLYQSEYIARLIAHGFTQLALKKLTHYIQTFAETAEAYYQRGDLQLSRGKFKLACQDFAEAEASGYASPLLYLQWGYALRALKRFKNGNQKLKKGLKLWLSKYQQRGYFFEQALGVLAAAGEDLSWSEHFEPTENEGEVNEYSANAIQCDDSLLFKPDFEALPEETLLAISAQALGLSLPQSDAENWLLEALAYLPRAAENPEPLFINAEALVEMGQAERALTSLKRGLRLLQGYPQGLRLCLEAYQALGDGPRALKIYTQLEKQTFLTAYDHKNRAELHHASGSFNAEQKDIQRAIAALGCSLLQRPPDDGNTVDLINLFLLFQSQKSLDTWLEWLNLLLRVYPLQAQLWYFRALTQAEAGNQVQALADLNQAIELEPDSALFEQALQKMKSG
jgi:tetratricopeptide (TPR) repeat protein